MLHNLMLVPFSIKSKIGIFFAYNLKNNKKFMFL